MLNRILIVGIAILIDVITGLLQALKNGTYKSCVMREGLYHKLGELLAVGLGVFCDLGLPTIGVILPFKTTTMITAYLVIMEIGSIVENLGKLSPDIASLLQDISGKIKVIGGAKNDDT